MDLRWFVVDEMVRTDINSLRSFFFLALGLLTILMFLSRPWALNGVRRVLGNRSSGSVYVGNRSRS